MVVLLLPFVLPAPIVVGRRLFTSASEERHGVPEETARERGGCSEPSALWASPA
jgi:hypothetical protein